MPIANSLKFALIGLLLAVPARAELYNDFFLSVGTAATSYILDGQPAPTRAYALQRLLTSYSTNKLVRIRRASDAAELDIGFATTGAIDTASAVTHCNATTCFLRTFYDQSGATADCIQTTTANQLAFLFGGPNGYPYLQATTSTQSCLTSANVTPATGIVSFNAVANRAAGTGSCSWPRENGNLNRFLARNAVANNWAIAGGTSGTLNGPTAADGSWHVATGIINTSASIVMIDGVDGASGTVVGNTTAGTAGILGVASTTCQLTTAILWDNVALSSAARTSLAGFQRAWWKGF